MRRYKFARSSILIAAALLGLAPNGRAAPPALSNITPRGVERGKPAEVVVVGANLTPKARLVLPFKASQEIVAEATPNPAQVKIKLNVDPITPVGVYPVRVMTEEGVSPLLLFSIDPFPNVSEVESNNTSDTAQKIGIPAVVTGEIAGNDVDYYRFATKKGQRLVMEAEAARLGSGVDPCLRLMDAQRRYVANSDDTPGLGADCRIIFTMPADGDYIIEVQDASYRANPPLHYRLKIGDYDVAEEVFPLGGRRGEAVQFRLRGGTLAKEIDLRQTLNDLRLRGRDWLRLDPALRPGMLAPMLAVGDLPERIWIKAGSKDPRQLDVLPPIVINSRLERKGDADRFQFAVKPSQRFRIGVEAEPFGSQLDGVLRVTDQVGKQIALVDDVQIPPVSADLLPTNVADPTVDITVPDDANLLIVELRDQRFRGGINFVYRLRIEPISPDFAIQQPIAEANVPRDGSVLLTVPIIRRGYTGPIQLAIPQLPAGLSIQGGNVPANGNIGAMLLSATADAPRPVDPYQLSIQGHATVEGQEVRRWAEQTLVLARDANVASAVLQLPSFAVGLTSPEPFKLSGPAALEVVKGYSADLPVQVTRAKGQEMLALQISGVVPTAPPPPGQPAPPAPVTAKETPVAAGAANGMLPLAAATNAPEGTFSFVVQGKAKVNNVDRTVVGSLVSVTVAKPFALEAATSTLTLPAGQTVALKGRIQRKPVFKEPVQLKLDGLPAGVTAGPLKPVAGDQTEFQIDLKVDAKAAAAMANLTLAASTTINGQAYAHPPVPIAAKVIPEK